MITNKNHTKTITDDALYYPYIQHHDDNFLKLSLLYRDKLNFIVPYNWNNFSWNENFRNLKSKNPNFFGTCVPTPDQIIISLGNSINILESYKNKLHVLPYERERKIMSLSEQLGYNVNDFKNLSSFHLDHSKLKGYSFILNGKFDMPIDTPSSNFSNYCVEEGLGIQLNDSLLVPDDIFCIYMKELANIISLENGLNKITDKAHLFEEIILSNKNLFKQDELYDFEIFPIIYNNMCPDPKTLSSVDINNIIDISMNEDFKYNRSKFRDIMSGYTNEIMHKEIKLDKYSGLPVKSFNEYACKYTLNKIKDDLKRISLVNSVDLFQKTDDIVTFMTRNPLLVEKKSEQFAKDVNNTIKKGWNQLITSSNTKSSFASYECLVTIDNLKNNKQGSLLENILHFVNNDRKNKEYKL